MTELLLPFITNEFWLQVFRFFFGSSLLLGSVALVIRLGLVQQLRLQSTLWKTAVIASLLLLLPFANTLLPAFTIGSPAVQHTIGPDIDINAAAMSSQANPLISTPDWLPGLSTLVLLLWVCISGTALLKFLLSHHRAMRALSPRQNVDPFSELRKVFVVQCRQAGIHPLPRLTVSDQITSPMTLTQGEVCLPHWMLESMSSRELACVMAHELAHIRHRDLWLAAAMHIVVCVFFFQPLLRMARDQLLDLAEFIADQEAVKSEADVEQVATVLVNCADRLRHQPDKRWGFAMVGNTSRLRNRVEMILAGKQCAGTAGNTSLRALLALALLSSIFFIPNLDSRHRTYAQDVAANGIGSSQPVSCTSAGYESIVDQVHAAVITPQDGLARWEQSCGTALGREIDPLWRENALPDHHLWFMANDEELDTTLLSPAMAALYRAWMTKQAISENQQTTDTSH